MTIASVAMTAVLVNGADFAAASPAGSVLPCDVSWNACRGSLVAGTYGTRLFTPPFTYAVGDGWVNAEDEDGNFLLVPPGRAVEAVDAGLTDYLGVYSSVRVPVACSEVADASVAATPAAIAEWLANEAPLVTTGRRPVSIGGLSGVMIDVSLSPDDGGCGGFYPILVGTGRSSLTHAVSAVQPLRLYLLDSEHGTLAIEVAEATRRGSASEDWYDEAQRIVDGLRFEDVELLLTVKLVGESCSMGQRSGAARKGWTAVGVVNQTGDRAVFDLVGLRRSGSFEQLGEHIDAEREAALAGRRGLGFPDELVDLVGSTGEMEPGTSARLLGYGYEEYAIVCLGYVEQAGELRPRFVAGPIALS